MKKLALCVAGFASAVSVSALPLEPAARVATVDRMAPEIDADRWYNHLGADPSITSLKGKTVLIEFWATW